MFAPLNGTFGVGPKTGGPFTLTLVPNTDVEAKKIGIGAVRIRKCYGTAYVQVNSVTIGQGPDAKVFTFNKQISLSNNGEWSYAGVGLIYVPLIADTPVTLSLSVSYAAGDANDTIQSVGFWLMLEE
jgi:hypothetical protein